MSLLRKALKILPLALVASVLVVGCGGDDPSGPDAGDLTADVNAYLKDMPSWEEFSPTMPDVDMATGDSETVDEIVDGEEFECETTPYSITRTPDKIITMNPDSEILWPGSLLQGKGYAEGLGSLAELPIRQRAPLEISIDLLTAGNTMTVEDPSLASVNQAVGTLIESAQNAGHTAGSNVLYTQERMHTLDQAMLKMGLSAKYKGVEVASNLEVSFSAEKTNVTAYFVQRMFTVSTVLPSTPGAFFSDEFTGNRLAEQVDRGRLGPDNLPVFVSNVAYGRMLMFSLSSNETEAKIRAALSVVLESGGTGGGTELEAEAKALMENAQIQVVTIGGDASHALALIRSGDLSEFFREDAPLTSARPISYTVRNLGDNSIAKVSETKDYSLRECTAEVLEPTGAEYKITLQQFKYVEWGGILCGGACPLITEYEFWVQDSMGEVLVAQYNPTVGAAMCAGAEWPLEFNGANALEATVRLHFDGRDSVRLRGHADNVTPQWHWNINWTEILPIGNRGSSTWSDAGIGCWRYAITYNIQKTGDLFD